MQDTSQQDVLADVELDPHIRARPYRQEQRRLRRAAPNIGRHTTGAQDPPASSAARSSYEISRLAPRSSPCARDLAGLLAWPVM